MFNPIELAWASLKSYVREHNTDFRLNDVRNLTQTWMASLDASTAASYLNHALNIENTFKKSDRFTEQIEEQIIDDDDQEENEMDSEEEEDQMLSEGDEEDDDQMISDEEEISE